MIAPWPYYPMFVTKLLDHAPQLLKP